MARPLRIEYSGAIYHITSRGNAGNPIFLDKEDRIIFLRILAHTVKRYNWLCHAYCMMNNHYHLIIETPDGNLSGGMRQLNGVYTQILNTRYKRHGHLFQGRYKAILIQKESYLLEVCRYVVLNPVRAKMAKKPEEWQWSSYSATAGSSKAQAFLATDWVLGQFNDNRFLAQQCYRKFVQDGIEKNSIWRELQNQGILGENVFIKKIVSYINKNDTLTEIPRVQRYIGRPSLEEQFKNVTAIDKKHREQKIAEAVEKYGYSQKEVADFIGLHYSTVSRLLRFQEDKK